MTIQEDFLIGNKEERRLRSDHSCVSGKRTFESEELALDALVQNHIRNEYRKGQGPINVYNCADCGWWHFTSKGEVNALLKDESVQKKIAEERRAFFWEQYMKS